LLFLWAKAGSGIASTLIVHWQTRGNLELKPKRSLRCLLVVVTLQIKEQLSGEKMNGGLRKNPPAAKGFYFST